MVQSVKQRKRGVFQLNSATVVRLMDVDDFFQLSIKETKMLRRSISVLTDKQLNMLTTVAEFDEGTGCTRADLAEWYEDGYFVGGAPEGDYDPDKQRFLQKLSDYRIGLLRVLVDVGLVVEHARGKTLVYFVPAGVKAFLDDMKRRDREQREAEREKQEAAERQRLQAPLWARLQELAATQGKTILRGDGVTYTFDGKSWRNTPGGLVEVEKAR